MECASRKSVSGAAAAVGECRGAGSASRVGRIEAATRSRQEPALIQMDEGEQWGGIPGQMPAEPAAASDKAESARGGRWRFL